MNKELKQIQEAYESMLQADHEFIEAERLDEAGMSAQQMMDFNRYIHGAMSKVDYQTKWKKKVDPVKAAKNKLDPTGVYHNLIKTVK